MDSVSVWEFSSPQKNRTSRRYLLTDLWQGIGLCDLEGWAGRLKIGSVGGQERQAGTLSHRLKMLSTGRFTSLESLSSDLMVFSAD